MSKAKLAPEQIEGLLKQREKFVKQFDKAKRSFLNDDGKIDDAEQQILDLYAKKLEELDAKLKKRGVIAAAKGNAKQAAPKDAAPPEHTLAGPPKTFDARVYLKDTNYKDEELGSWHMIMEVALTKTGQVYPLNVKFVSDLDDPASRIISEGATISSRSVNQNGKRYCDIDFNVKVAGPNVCTTNSISLGANIGWKNKAETVEAGGSASWSHSTSSSSQGAATWVRRFRITGGKQMKFTTVKGQHFKNIKNGKLVIDDDSGFDDRWGIDTDWDLITY